MNNLTKIKKEKKEASYVYANVHYLQASICNANLSSSVPLIHDHLIRSLQGPVHYRFIYQFHAINAIQLQIPFLMQKIMLSDYVKLPLPDYVKLLYGFVCIDVQGRGKPLSHAHGYVAGVNIC